jgi:quercetin dioxygenase-like cupin family protein
VNLQGKGKLIVDGVEHDFAMGEIVIIEPGENHELIRHPADESDPLVNLWLHAE